MRTTLGIPTVGNIVPALPGHLGAAVELGRLGKVIISSPNNALPHDRAREAVLDDAFTSDSDYLLFLDADTLMPAGGVGKLFSALKATAAQVVSGHYYQRGYPYACIWARLDAGVSRHVDARSGTHVIHGCGMGAALIDLNWCREHLTRPYFRIVDTPGQPRLWEDFYFCKLVQEAEGLVIGAADVRCAHLGNPECVDDNSADLLRRLWIERDRLEGNI